MTKDSVAGHEGPVIKVPRRFFHDDWLHLPLQPVRGDDSGLLAIPVDLLSDPGISRLIAAEIAGDGYEPAERDAIVAGVQEVEWFIDVGAHFGLFSVLASIVNPDLKTVALEPHPANFQCLEETIRLNAFESRIQRLNQAASRNTGAAYLRKNLSMGHHLVDTVHPDASVVSVDCIALDRLIDRCFTKAERHSIWLKIDTEGRESAVIEGADELLQQGLVRGIVWEYRVGDRVNPHADELRTHLQKFGFHNETISEHSVLSTAVA